MDQALIDNPEIRRLRDAITLLPDDAIPGHAADVSLETSSHETLRHRIDPATGSIDNPMTPAQIKRKFMSQAALVMSGDAAERAYDALSKLQDADDTADVVARFLAV